uniref:Protein FAR1-RELATED SEQUENCE 3-like n=1 Tax=Nicotiana tabacum TaxID=4097 RepID=A0A1S3YR30_TOBAC|nr:PREDICTED: protein FAR1-RELATED SEQUENCE 3-like [Nicotiana tabacum]
MQLLRRSPSESYKKMPTYLYMLEYPNPGSVTRLDTEGDESFLYAFIAIYASIRGWVYCRPTVVVDGSFLKSTYRGTILTASTQDAEGQILPFAYAIVDSENDASWEWFFVQFRETYGQREGMCIVSDRHDAIWKATSIVYPEVPHCACMFHLWNNIKTNFRKSQKQIKEVYFELARAYTIEEFNRHMAELEAIDSRVKTYLMDIGYDKWSRAHSKANRTMTMTSNIAESVNAANKHARDLPVVNLLDFMTTLIQKWNYTNRKDAVESFMKIGANIDYLLKIYEIPVNPLPDETTWQIPEDVSSQVVLPPKGKIKPGRPKKKRCIGGWEGNTVTCALCERKGHNRRTCRNIPKRD